MIYINNPPISHLDLNKFNEMNFILPHLFNEEVYWKYFLTRDLKKYSILDNSACELGVSISDIRLLDYAKKFEVNEIVVPDVWKNKKLTIKRCEDFFKNKKIKSSYKFMLVPQGEDLIKLKECLDWMLKFDALPNRKKVIGLNKSWFNIQQIKIGIQLIKDHSYDIEIHKLGCNTLREWFNLKYLPGLRSADSRIFAKLISDKDDPWKSLFTAKEVDLFKKLVKELK